MVLAKSAGGSCSRRRVETPQNVTGKDVTTQLPVVALAGVTPS
jgi:hypothetical protein